MFFRFFLQKMDEWTNLIGSYGFIHYVQVDDSTKLPKLLLSADGEIWDLKLSLHLDIYTCSTAVRMQQVYTTK
jgi:hypothetical protein